MPTPCRKHGGVARLDEGSGICTGNFETVIPLNTIGFSLHHNSSSPGEASPFGKGFSISAEAWFQKTSSVTGKVVTGDGLEIPFQKSTGSDLWYPINSLESNHWLEFIDNRVLEKSPEGIEITYLQNPSSPLLYSIKFYRHISGSSLEYLRSNNRITQIRFDNGQTILINYVVNPASNRPNIEIRDFLSNTYGLFIDASNHLTKVSFPDTRQEILTYRGDFITSIVYPNQERLSLDYDVSGNLNSITNPDGLVTRLAYTSNSVSAVHPRIEFTESFDTEQRIISSSTNGQRTTFERDLLGRVIRLTNPLGLITTFSEYGTNQLPNRITRSDGTVENYTYNSNGNVTNLITNINGTVVTESTLYNSLFQPTKITSRGQSTEYAYDSKGYLTEVKSSTQGVIYKASYDASGNLLSATDKNGLITSYSYNSKNQLTRINYPTGKIQTLNPDALGRSVAVGLPPNISQSSQYSDTGDTSISTTTLAVGSTPALSDIKTYTPRADGGGISTTQQFVGPDRILNETTEFDKRGRVIRSTRQ